MNRVGVHHLGRAGEVPGGMTQVLNGYLAWSFEDVDVHVITTRGDPGDHRAAFGNAALALLRVARLPRGRSVVVAHLSERGSFVREGLLLLLARLRGIATVAHLHGSDFAEFAHHRPALVRSVLRAADRVVSLSTESSEVAARFTTRGRIVLVPNALPPGAPGEKKRTVVFGGVVSHRKGVDVLLDAWEAAGGATTGWQLLIAGPVREPEVLRDVPRVEVLGSQPHAALMRLLDTAQVAVLPSRAEAMPMFVLEAMARRTCVVATAVGGIVPVLASGRGWLLPAGDVPALTTALTAVLSDATMRAELADAAFDAFTSTYSADAVFPLVRAVWLAALDDATGRRTKRAPSAATT